MSEEEFEVYLRLLGRFLRLNDRQRGAIGSELRGHMEERLTELLERGYTREDAITTILDEFGDAAALSAEFGRVSRRRTIIMRTTIGTIGVAAAVLIVSFLMPVNRAHVPAPPYTMADESTAVAQADKPETAKQAKTETMYVTPESEADKKARQKLVVIIPKIQFIEDTPLEDVIELLRVEGNVSIDVNWTELDLFAVDRTTLIKNIDLKNVKLETALEVILDRLGGPDVDLGFDVFDGIIRISSIEKLSKNTIVRVYDCNDLIYRPVDKNQLATVKAVLHSLYQSGQTGGMGGMGMMGAGSPRRSGGGYRSSYGGGGYGGGGDDDDDSSLIGLSDLELTVYQVMNIIEEEREERAEDIEDLVKSHVYPDTWECDDGPGSMDIYDGFFVIRHFPRAHREVEKFLKLIRDAKAARDSAQAQKQATTVRLTGRSLSSGTTTQPSRGSGRGFSPRSSSAEDY